MGSSFRCEVREYRFVTAVSSGSAIVVLLVVLALSTPAYADSTTTPAGAFTRQVAAQVDGVRDRWELGIWDVSAGQTTTFVFSKDGVEFACRAVGEDENGTTQVIPSCLVWEVHNRGGQLVKYLFVGWLPDGQCDENGDCDHLGELSGTPLATLMFIGTGTPGDTIVFDVFGLRAFPDQLLTSFENPGNPLEWTYTLPGPDGAPVATNCWQFLFSALGVQRDGANTFDIVADATAIEYGLIATLIGVAIISGAQTLGDQLNTTFTTISGLLSGTVDRHVDEDTACATDAECDPGEVCSAGDCGPCSEDAQCSAGLLCRFDGLCVECVSDIDCDPGSVCQISVCEDAPGCVSNADCPGTSCLTSGECGLCGDETDCPGGLACDPNGICY